MSKSWYVLQVKPGSEKKAKEFLEERIRLEKKEEQFGQVLIPSENTVEMRGGKKRHSERRFFPGYVLIEMEMDESLWHLVRRVPKVLGFVGGTAEKPATISEKEVDLILQRVQEGTEKPKPKVLFEMGEAVRVVDGPFADFNGVVEEVNYDKNRLRVAVLIFGRATPVDLDFSQVEKG